MTPASKNIVSCPIRSTGTKVIAVYVVDELGAHPLLTLTLVGLIYVWPCLLLYNSETWTLTKTQEQSLDAFHRRLLRIALNYRYPKIIKNSHLYNLSKEIPISEKIKKRRLALFGHILRLHQDTPAQKALDYYMIPCKRPVGRPPTTWLSVITKDLKSTLMKHEIKKPLNKKSLQKLRILASDNILWREEIARSMKCQL